MTTPCSRPRVRGRRADFICRTGLPFFDTQMDDGSVFAHGALSPGAHAGAP